LSDLHIPQAQLAINGAGLKISRLVLVFGPQGFGLEEISGFKVAQEHSAF